MLAISCPGDSVVATISELKKSACLYVNKRRQKLWVLPQRSSGSDSMHVVSTQSDSVIAVMYYRNLLPRMACNEATDRLYGFDPETILEFDCVGDSCIRGRHIYDYPSREIVCDSARNRVYLWGSNCLVEIDCTTLDIVSVIGVEAGGDALGLDPPRYRVMGTAGRESGVLAVFDYKHDTTYVRGAAPLCGWRGILSHNPATGKLYYRWGSNVGGVGVIDESVNRVVAQAFLSRLHVREWTYSQTSNKFYFFAHGGVGVMDGANDSLLGVIDMGSDDWPCPCWCPDRNKLYCFGDWYIAVVDCDDDSVVRRTDMDHIVEWFEYLGNSRMLCNASTSLVLIDSRTDSILVDSAIGDVRAVAHAGGGEKFYIARRYPGRLEVRSSSSLSLLKTLDWPYFDYSMTFLMYSDATQKLYWFVDDSVLAIDAASDTVLARMATSVEYKGACLDRTGRYLFCVSPPSDSCVRVYDTQTDSLVGMYTRLPYPISIAANPELGCIYVGCTDVILVYPDAPPGVEEGQPQVPSYKPEASVVRGVLFLPENASPSSRPSPSPSTGTSRLIDVSGRKVMDLRPGANDVRVLSPGVYFVLMGLGSREHGESQVRKVVVAR